MALNTGKPRRWRYGVVLALALLSACSSTKFVYNRLDFVVPFIMGRYVDLNREQASDFEVRTDALLEWHRREELPRYAALASAMQAELDQPRLTLSQVQYYTDEFETTWYRLRDRILDEILQIGVDLSDEQIDDFIEVLRKKQRKYERKYKRRDDDEVVDDSYEEILDAVETAMGRLQPEQRKRVRAAAEALMRSDGSWLEERAQWIEVTAEDLQRAPGWQERIRSRVIDWEARTDAETMALYEHNTRVIQEMIVDLVNARTERQEKRLRKRLTRYREDFLALSTEE